LFSRPRDLNPFKEEIHDGSEKESRKEKEEALKSSGAKSPYSREIVVNGCSNVEHPFLFDIHFYLLDLLLTRFSSAT
jgi:hypothetical protein